MADIKYDVGGMGEQARDLDEYTGNVNGSRVKTPWNITPGEMARYSNRKSMTT